MNGAAFLHLAFRVACHNLILILFDFGIFCSFVCSLVRSYLRQNIQISSLNRMDSSAPSSRRIQSVHSLTHSPLWSLAQNRNRHRLRRRKQNGMILMIIWCFNRIFFAFPPIITVNMPLLPESFIVLFSLVDGYPNCGMGSALGSQMLEILRFSISGFYFPVCLFQSTRDKTGLIHLSKFDFQIDHALALVRENWVSSTVLFSRLYLGGHWSTSTPLHGYLSLSLSLVAVSV